MLKRSMMIITVGLIAMGVTSGCEKKGDPSTKAVSQSEPTAVVGDKQSYPKAPNFQLKDLSGKSVSLSDFAGKMVILDFWATWCPPCRAEMPDFIKLYNEFRQRGLVIVGIAADQGGQQVVEQFVKENQVNYPILMYDMKVISDYGGISGIPTTFIINKKGEIVSQFVGYRDENVFRQEIQRWLHNPS